MHRKRLPCQELRMGSMIDVRPYDRLGGHHSCPDTHHHF
jgi:hypothetical protein